MTAVKASGGASGDGAPSAALATVDNPATGETIAQVPMLDEGQVAALVARAREA